MTGFAAGVAAAGVPLAAGDFVFSMLCQCFALPGEIESVEDGKAPPFVHPKVSNRLASQAKLPGKYAA